MILDRMYEQREAMFRAPSFEEEIARKKAYASHQKHVATCLRNRKKRHDKNKRK